MSDTTVSAQRPVIVAHRGWWRSHGLVENSTRAFEMARAGGFEAECDVWPAADGEPVVIHDQTLDRTTTGRGQVATYRSDELRKIRLREPERGAPVPLLADVANLVSYVEVKAPDSPQFVRRVIEIMGSRRWLMQSFDEKTLAYCRDLSPQVPIALLVEEPSGFELALDRMWPVHADHAILTDGIVAQLRKRGLRVGAWTVNAEADILRVLRRGLDVIISDEPLLVRQLAGRKSLDAKA
jgi:glycerophosphoryl diester phosphodiesterase